MSSIKDKLQALPEISKLQLADILNDIPGKKDLIVHESVLKLLNHVINIHDLRSCGIEKIFKLDSNNSSVSIKSSTGVIISFGDLQYIKTLCGQVSSELHKNGALTYHCIIIPQVTSAIEILIEEEGLFDIVQLHSLVWQPMLKDDNVISLELPNVFSSLFLKKNLLVVQSLANSLEHFFAIFGQPKISFIHGDISNDIYKSLNKLCFNQNLTCAIDYFIMFDRNIDYASVLFTPATYAGFLDELFGINNDTIEISNGNTINKRKDQIYNEIKFNNFIDVSNYLKDKSKYIQNEQDNCKNSMSMSQLKQYINQNLKSILELKKQIGTHIAACEQILHTIGQHYGDVSEVENNISNDVDRRNSFEFINNMLCCQKLNKEHILQLTCLLSYYSQGLAKDDYDMIKSNFLNAFGYKYLITFYNLEKIKLLTKKSKHKINSINAQTQILNNELKSLINKFIPSNDAHENISKKITFNNRYYVTKIIELIIVHKLSVDQICKLYTSAQCYTTQSVVHNKEKMTFVVYVVGGITTNEISCLNLLEKQLNVEIVIYSSNMINGADMMHQCMTSL